MPTICRHFRWKHLFAIEPPELKTTVTGIWNRLEPGGNALDKVVEVINYLSQKVNSLHKVKLMKMLWYSDTLNFKRHGKSITGLAYSVLKMGAVPKGYEEIMILDGVSYDVVIYDDVAYKFKPTPGFEIKKLSAEEIASIDKIIDVFGDLNTDQIVARMHEEDAYKYTSSNGIISYSFAEQLSIE